MKKQLEPLSNEKGFYYFIPNASECVSYDNLLFVQKFINGAPNQVEDAVYILEGINDEEGGFGIGILLNRMRELYERDERYRVCSLESLAHVALNKMPNSQEWGFEE